MKSEGMIEVKRGGKWGLTEASGLGVVGVILGVGLLVGCAHKLTVQSEPSGTLVTVKLEGSTAKVKPNPAPYEASVNFKEGTQNYTVSVDPVGNLVERYNPANLKVTSEIYDSLPMVGNSPKHRRLSVRLDEKLYVILPHVEVVLDSSGIWKGIVTRSRAYKDIREADGAAANEMPVTIEDGTTVQSLAISPDGDRVVYSVVSFGLPQSELKKLLTVAEHRIVPVMAGKLNAIRTSAGGIEHISVDNHRDFFPTFTFDGQNILFTSNRRRASYEDILLRSATGRQGISDFHTVDREERLLRPTQAENGMIAYSVEVPNPVDSKQRYTIWTKGGPNQYATQIQVGTQPCISPDGRRIAYIGADGNLWVVNTDGSAPTQLTDKAAEILERYKKSLGTDEVARYEAFVRDAGVPERMPYSYPSWSRDGSYLVFTGMEGSDPGGRPNEDVWVMGYDGSGKRQLTTNGSVDRHPVMSPDGKWVYFMSNRGGRWAIWRIAGPEAQTDRN